MSEHKSKYVRASYLKLLFTSKRHPKIKICLSDGAKQTALQYLDEQIEQITQEILNSIIPEKMKDRKGEIKQIIITNSDIEAYKKKKEIGF